MKFIPYYRCSTQRQNVSGLGLEAQKSIVENYIRSVNGEVVKEFIEVESGGNKERISIDSNISLDTLLNRRPILLQAIRKAKEENAFLIVKDSSRLSRFSLLIDYLLSCNVAFLSAESPMDTPFLIKLKVSLAEEELLVTAKKTAEALKALSERGYKWTPKYKFSTTDIKTASKRRKEIAYSNMNNRRAMGYILQLRNSAGLTYQAIADKLNGEGFKTSTGKKFAPTTVMLLYRRGDKNNADTTE